MPEIREGGQARCPDIGRGVRWGPNPEGSSDVGGGDDINAHASGRFLRVPDSGLAAPPGPRSPGRYHARVIPLVLVATGVVALAAGWLAMRRIGPGARIGRILASTPVVSIATARQLAEARTNRYVGVGGRLDSEAAFEDEHGRPLVLRRTRLELASGGGWRTIEDYRDVVPFGLSEGLDTIAVDGDALDEGLVVVRRESNGTAGEIPERLPAGTPPTTPVRMRQALLTTVDHAMALGVPVMDPSLGPVLRPGLGRPLIVSTLETGEAMRVLAGDRRGSARIATALLAGAVVLLASGLAWTVIDALA